MLPRMFRFDTPTARLRAVAILEGTSFVLLLFVAMPLKYAWGMPEAVRVLGAIHGGLFIALAWLVLQGLGGEGRGLGWGARIMIASLLPFGTFVLDGRLRREDEEYRRAQAR